MFLMFHFPSRRNLFVFCNTNRVLGIYFITGVGVFFFVFERVGFLCDAETNVRLGEVIHIAWVNMYFPIDYVAKVN
jgi:hypothetical protein